MTHSVKVTTTNAVPRSHLHAVKCPAGSHTVTHSQPPPPTWLAHTVTHITHSLPKCHGVSTLTHHKAYSLTHLKCRASCQGTEDTPCVATYPYIRASTGHKENHSKCHTQSYINETILSHTHTGHMWCHKPSQSESATLRYNLPHTDLTLTPYQRLSAPSQYHPHSSQITVPLTSIHNSRYNTRNETGRRPQPCGHTGTEPHRAHASPKPRCRDRGPEQGVQWAWFTSRPRPSLPAHSGWPALGG